MKLSVLSENLQKALSLINHAVSPRSQLPILSQTLFLVEKDKATLSATDLEIGIETEFSVNTEVEGSVAIPAKLFLELVNVLPQEKIEIESKDGYLVIKSKKSQSELQTTPKDEFPSLYEELGEKVLSFSKGEVKNLFEKIIFASSLESTRPALSGVLISQTKEGIVFVATDGYRLSLESVVNDKVSGKIENQIILPARLLREVVSLSSEEGIDLFVTQKNNQAVFVQENTKIIGRLIEADFPNYEKILPTDTATTVSFDREEMLRAVKSCAIFARESANIITFALGKEKISVSAKTPSLGENKVDVEARLKGEENEIAFNARYLLDVLGGIKENEMVFEMTGPLNPGIFKTLNNPNYLHLIMPIRVQE